MSETVSDTIEVSEPTEVDDSTEVEVEPEATFGEGYVKELRAESGKYRNRAKDAEQRADDYARRLHLELVRATGRLADPGDLAFDVGHLDDTDALTAAIDALLESKPHFAARKVSGDIGQGARPTSTPAVSLSTMLRDRAR